jgi:hypothetical protein
MESGLHDIVNGLGIARAHAEIIADDIAHSDPEAAAILRKWAEETWNVWTHYLPLLPSNQRINMLRYSPRNEAISGPS